MSDVIVLASGGLDSIVCLHLARRDNPDGRILALFFNYNQRALEHERASVLHHCSLVGAKFMEMDIDLSFTGNKMIQGNSEGGMEMPMRNLIFLGYAESLRQLHKYDFVIAGIIEAHNMEYADCKTEFIESMEYVMPLIAPLEELTKQDVLREAMALGIDWNTVFSCNTPVDGHPCGQCSDCKVYVSIWDDIFSKSDCVNKEAVVV